MSRLPYLFLAAFGCMGLLRAEEFTNWRAFADIALARPLTQHEPGEPEQQGESAIDERVSPNPPTLADPASSTQTANDISTWSSVQVYTLLGMGVMPEGPYEPLSSKQMKILFVKENFTTPAAYILPWLSAIPMQANGYPDEWNGFSGYAKRAGSRYLGFLVARSVSYPLMDAFDMDPRYMPCRCDDGGFWKRLGHAVLFNYVTVNAKQKKVFHFPRFLGAFAGEFASQAVYPGEYDASRAAKRASGVLIFGWWLNVLREFRPEIVGAIRGK